jgi:hypothetical protein
MGILKALFYLVIIALVLAFCNKSSTKKYSTSYSNQPIKVSPHQKAMEGINLNFAWSKEGFDNVMMADFTVSNKSQFDVKDIEVVCRHYSPSGTEIDQNTRTIYESFPSGQTREIKKFNMGFLHSQATKSGCRISDLVVTSKPKQASPVIGDIDIKSVQQLLNSLGYSTGVPDGSLGPKTKAAIQAFQRDNSLAPDGQLTESLNLRLKSAIKLLKAKLEKEQAGKTEIDPATQAEIDRAVEKAKAALDGKAAP